MDHNKQIKGAVYFPSRAYNAYQTWMYFDRTVIARDFGYAKSAGLNALRIFTSYEYWQEEAELFWKKFESLLSVAEEQDILVMPILFENCGRGAVSGKHAGSGSGNSSLYPVAWT